MREGTPTEEGRYTKNARLEAKRLASEMRFKPVLECQADAAVPAREGNATAAGWATAHCQARSSRVDSICEAVLSRIRSLSQMARIATVHLCELAFFDNCDRLCLIGVTTTLPVPTLPVAIHQLMIAVRILDR